MENLEDKIKQFLAIDIGFGKGIGDALGFGHENGIDFCGIDVSGDGFGDASGHGFSDGSGFGAGDGMSDGDGSGYFGIGYGTDEGIKEINGKKIYMVDDCQTIFTFIHGNVAQGYILQSDLQLKPCFIVKENNKFAHGDTLRDAFTSLQEKLYDDSTEEERIEAFKQKFPNYDDKYDNRDLFAYHHVLTGSCRMGRESFVKDKGLSLDGKTSVREFVELTKDSYGGEIIKSLAKEYRKF